MSKNIGHQYLANGGNPKIDHRASQRPMAILVVFTLLLQSLISNGQNKKETVLWVGEFNNYLRIDSDAIRVNYSLTYNGRNFFHARAHKYKFVKDTLRILEEGFRNDETYDYLIRKFSEDRLTLTALNNSFGLLAPKDSVGRTFFFKTQSKIATDTIRFQKILFSTTNCYGICPAMIFQIDSLGMLKFKGERLAVKEGFYQAKVPNEIMQQLLSILSVSELDKIKNYSEFNIDASTHTLEVYYNNKSMFIKTAFMPYVLYNLLEYLLALPGKLELLSMEEMEFKFSH